MSTQTCNAPSPPEQSVRNALQQVIDPELGENIVDLGLVYGIEITENVARVTLTMTSPACPMGEMLLVEIHAKLAGLLPGNMEFDIRLVWEPPWNPSMISGEAKRRLGWT